MGAERVPSRGQEGCGSIDLLCEKYRGLLYGLILHMVRDSWTAEDLLQDVLMKLTERACLLQRLEERDLIRYAMAACRNRVRNYLRDVRIHGRAIHGWAQTLPRQEEPVREERLILQEDLSKLNRAWAELDERSRYLLEHYYLLEESTQEIGRKLGLKPASVRMALSRARKRTFVLMNREEPGDAE